jgi:hypothetical protein
MLDELLLRLVVSGGGWDALNGRWLPVGLLPLLLLLRCSVWLLTIRLLTIGGLLSVGRLPRRGLTRRCAILLRRILSWGRLALPLLLRGRSITSALRRRGLLSAILARRRLISLVALGRWLLARILLRGRLAIRRLAVWRLLAILSRRRGSRGTRRRLLKLSRRRLLILALGKRSRGARRGLLIIAALRRGRLLPVWRLRTHTWNRKTKSEEDDSGDDVLESDSDS